MPQAKKKTALTRQAAFNIDFNKLTGHALIGGVTGSGKTNTCFALINQLSHSKIPFLVIEPVKSEYRHFVLNNPVLKDRGRIYTLGNPGASPLKINPFEVPEGVRVQAHIDALVSLFAAAFDMYTPMPEVLKQALVDLYRLKGWDLTLNENLREYDSIKDELGDIYPNMQDLYESIESTARKMTFSDSVATDVQGALESIIGSLVTGTNSLIYLAGTRIPPHVLFSEPVVIELQEIADEAERAFCLGSIVLSLCHFAKKRGSAQQLKHLLLIDDAHRLFDSPAKINTFFKNILSEIGSYGEGVVFSSQIPASLHGDILSNTGVKIIHRLTRSEDLNAVLGAGFLSDIQKKEITSLALGKAVILSESMSDLERCQFGHNFLRRETNGSSLEDADEQLQNAMKKFNQSKRDSVYIDDEYTLLVANHKSFRNLYNRFMLSFSKDYMQLVHFRSQIIREVQRILGGRSNLGDLSEFTWRALVIATHRYLQRKGEDNFWPHEEVRKLEKRWLKLLKMAFNPGKKTPKLSLYEIQAWRNSFLKMSERDQGPYPTCGPCQAKCAYRFEVNELSSDSGVTFDFNTAINSEAAAPSENAAYFCRVLNDRLVGQTDLEISYCLAVHLFMAQNLSVDSQTILLNKTRQIMEEQEESGT
ncbi:MAG: DUF87 domain-containing protein [Candidatus Melainabacteria bacterium]|nr:DUF87 domain-containing protein [Candidatus Melainabacteria bacterium]